MTKRWKQRPDGSTWGDWGDDDELGRVNLLTSEKVLEGVREVEAGVSFCLSLPLDYPGGTSLNQRRSPPVVSPTEDMKGVSPAAFTDHLGTPLPWHNCSGSNYTPLGNGQMFFYTKGIPIDPTGTCVQGNCNVIRDYYDFMRYTQSTQGHLNSQGLCYVARQYPSPSGNSAAQ